MCILSNIKPKNIIFNNNVNLNYGTFDLNAYINPNECVICLERKRDKLTMPCRHYSMCGKCSDKLKICPICRAGIKESIDVIIV